VRVRDQAAVLPGHSATAAVAAIVQATSLQAVVVQAVVVSQVPLPGSTAHLARTEVSLLAMVEPIPAAAALQWRGHPAAAGVVAMPPFRVVPAGLAQKSTTLGGQVGAVQAAAGHRE
jgi:hypothetical protein